MDSTVEKGRDAASEARGQPRLRVREACAGDVNAMVDLLTCLFEQEADFTPSPAQQRRALELLLAQPSWGRLFVISRGSDVLGMVSLLFTVSTAEGGRVAWLEDMVVRPGWRGKGLGTRLLRAASAWAEKQGLRRISLLTDATNTGARQLYRRQGFVPSAMVPLRLYLPHGRRGPARRGGDHA